MRFGRVLTTAAVAGPLIFAAFSEPPAFGPEAALLSVTVALTAIGATV